MKAMRLESVPGRLAAREVPIPHPQPNEVLLRVQACGVCRTDLHLLDGEIEATLPVTPGHQVVGTVEETGSEVRGLARGDRVGVPWLGWTCGACRFCLSDAENLCDHARFTGCTIDGGFAEFAVADARYCFTIPSRYDALAAAPLLCAGLIGYRAYRMIGDALDIGFYGFGSAAHILVQLAVADGKQVHAFTRPGDTESQRFALAHGAARAGPADAPPHQPLDAAIIFAPSGELVPRALAAVRKGGIVVCAGIHMSEIPSFPYSLLWGERVVRSVANLTRADGHAFFEALGRTPVRVSAKSYELTSANEALEDLRTGRIEGSAVLVVAG